MRERAPSSSDVGGAPRRSPGSWPHRTAGGAQPPCSRSCGTCSSGCSRASDRRVCGVHGARSLSVDRPRPSSGLGKVLVRTFVLQGAHVISVHPGTDDMLHLKRHKLAQSDVVHADAMAAELKKLRGMLSTLPPGDRGPLACLAGVHLLTEAVQDYQLALETADDTEVCRVCALLSPRLEHNRRTPPVPLERQPRQRAASARKQGACVRCHHARTPLS